MVYDGVTNLYPIEVDAAYLTSVQRTTTKISYDVNSGLLVTSKDADNGVTSTYTYDNIGRQTKVVQSGNSLSRSTTTLYDDVALSVKTTQDQTGINTTTYYDPLGRARLTVDGDGNESWQAYRTCLSAPQPTGPCPGGFGISYALTSNPYPASSGSGSTDGWTLTMRNSVADTVTTSQYSGATPPAPWGGAPVTAITGTTTSAANQAPGTCGSATAGSGPTTTVTDEAGNVRTYCQDGLGRLTGVTEPDGTSTQYTYNQLDQPVQVTMGTQIRTFQYSATGLLTGACNPESVHLTPTSSPPVNCTTTPLPATALTSFTYDAAGNLITRTDARGAMATFGSYDGLNRPAGITYTSTGATASATPAVTYGYDQDTKGALSLVSTSVPAAANLAGQTLSTAYTHDDFGRIKTSTQTTGTGSTYTFQYQYSMADQLTQIKYPSGRTIDYTPDTAGLITSVTNDTTGIPYASAVYTPSGGVATLTMPKITETWSWNDRQQVVGIAAGPPGGTALLSLGLYPCTGQVTFCTTGNTGSIQSDTIAAPNVGFSQTQTQTYDALNRLKTSGEGSTSWSQAYSFDQPGNRWVTSSPGFTLSSFTPTVGTNYNAYNQLQLLAAQDNAGNQTSDGAYASVFDAAGRMVSNANTGTTTYVYDGDGQRVMKQNWLETTTYVYDAAGNLAAEYAVPVAGQTLPTGETNPCGTATCYVTVDHLGSTRLVTDSNGNVARRYDYLPWGEEIPVGTGGRTAAMGYQFDPTQYAMTGGQDGFNPKFTGQMRDFESGLDYFNARYYSPAQGRFVAPHPDNAGADLANSQTWNGYGYVSDNPLSYTDPSGLFIEAAGLGSAADPPVR